MSVEGLKAEQVEDARRQLIEWIGPDGGPIPTHGALSDLLKASRQWLECRVDPVAAVRAAVESGTIEGDVMHWTAGDLEPGTYLVVPLVERDEEEPL